MGTKLPSASVPGNMAANQLAINKWHQEKTAWQFSRAAQGNRTVDVLRTTVAGGSAARGIEPTYTAVTGLTGLDAYAERELKMFESRYGGLIEDASILFILYDVTDAIEMQDRIEYNGNRFRPLQVDFEAESGKVEVLAKLDRSDV